LPIGPISQERIALELGLEGFFRAPSRPIPKISGGRGEAFFSPRKGSRSLAAPPFSAANSGASSGSGGLGAAQVCCEQTAVQKESRTPKFYRMRREFTRRFSVWVS